MLYLIIKALFMFFSNTKETYSQLVNVTGKCIYFDISEAVGGKGNKPQKQNLY